MNLLTMLIWLVVFAIVLNVGTAANSMEAVFALALIACIPVGIKRLHDRDKSTWWLLVFFGVPFGLSFLAPALSSGFDGSTGGVIVQYVGFAILLWGLIELGAIRGTIGGNPYGPDPVAPKPAVH